MTSYIIATRNPTTKKLLIVVDKADDVAEFESEDAAFETAQTIAVCRAWGAEILPVGGTVPAGVSL